MTFLSLLFCHVLCSVESRIYYPRSEEFQNSLSTTVVPSGISSTGFDTRTSLPFLGYTTVSGTNLQSTASATSLISTSLETGTSRPFLGSTTVPVTNLQSTALSTSLISTGLETGTSLPLLGSTTVPGTTLQAAAESTSLISTGLETGTSLPLLGSTTVLETTLQAAAVSTSLISTGLETGTSLPLLGSTTVPGTTLQAAALSISPISSTSLEIANLLPSRGSTTFLGTNLQPTMVSTTQISATTVDSHFAELDSSFALDGAGTNAPTAAPTGTRATTGPGRTNMYGGVPFPEATSDAALHTTTVAIQSSEYHEVPIPATTADSAFEADIHTTAAIQSEVKGTPFPASTIAADTTTAMHNMYHGVPFLASDGKPSLQSTVQHITSLQQTTTVESDVAVGSFSPNPFPSQSPSPSLILTSSTFGTTGSSRDHSSISSSTTTPIGLWSSGGASISVSTSPGIVWSSGDGFNQNIFSTTLSNETQLLVNVSESDAQKFDDSAAMQLGLCADSFAGSAGCWPRWAWCLLALVTGVSLLFFYRLFRISVAKDGLSTTDEVSVLLPEGATKAASAGRAGRVLSTSQTMNPTARTELMRMF
eukprot:CAMPEP_0194486828 /NCGR_PEP_ID=MMETSP0253-20130528/7330_1 /TAXON_ID=2966 /ORGANISM="Noctiluca scintillans" /LENGTH=593 /DNA_ID=CAMNT_0039326969 /DNA_START=3 /DNA_END=1784 /DNA_ORIENTATION=-